MKKNKKNAVAIILVLSLFLPFSTLAYKINLGSYIGSPDIKVNEILKEVNTTGISSVSSLMEDRYGLNKDSWRTAQRKETAPKVEISFDNMNPKVGEKVTANAVPEFFKNDPQNLYYTWYIIHTTDGTPQTATGSNPIEKGKIEAAKIMTRGDYNPDLDGQTYSDPGKDPDSDGWPSVDNNSYDSGKDQAPMGGADGVGGLAKDSDNLDPSLSEYCGSQATSANCSLFTAKSSFNSYYQFNGAQSNSYCSTCASETLSWGTLSSNNECCHNVLYPNSSDPSYIDYDSATAYCPTSYDSAYESCFDYATLQSTNQSAINSCLSTQYTACKDDYDTNHSSSTVSGDNGSDFSRCFKHDFGTSSNTSGYQGYEGSSGSYGNDDSGLDYNVTCKHKWADATGFTSGSGKFTTGEEDRWGTDPTDPDTDGDGFVDGADVIGLGQQDFTWTYQSGDRIGVVIEGTSMIPTDEKTAYYKIMWGYLDVCDNTKTGLLDNDGCDGSGDYGYGFLATKSPNESGDEKLKVSLSFSPDAPVADPSDDNKDNIDSDGSISDADKITVTSSLDNTTLDPSTLYYTWQIQKGTVGDESSWKELKPLTDYFDTTTSASGLGLSSLSLTPKTGALKGDDDIVSFKVTLTVSKSSGTKTGSGRSSTTVSVNKKGIKLKFYKVDVKNGKATVGDEICKDGLYKTLCPVVKGQMVAAEVSGSYTSSNSDFSWSINETAYPVPTGLSDSFDEWSDTRVFFPVTQSEKDTPSVVVTATPKDSLQPVTGTRLLTVVAPASFINSSDTSSSWLKTYEDADGQTVESSGFFEAYADTEVSYSLDFVPDYLLGSDSNTTIDWQIDGVSTSSADFSGDNFDISDIITESTNKTIQFTTGSTETSHTLGVTVKKYWSTDEKKLIYSTWGITPENLSDDSSVSIESVAIEGDEDVSANTTGQILAAIGTHLPHYFMYLLRLVLTMAVMFVVSAGFYGATRRLSLSDEEK